MFEKLQSAIAVVREAVASAELAGAGRDASVQWFDAFADLQRLSSAGSMVAGQRVVATRAWHGSGQPNPAAWMAARSQVTLGNAVASLETAEKLADLPATREAFVAGALSAQQAHEIAAAATADPCAEAALLDAAAKETVNSLRQQCRQVIAAASRDLDDYERLHQRRSLRIWSDADGMRRWAASLPPDASAPLEAVVQSRAQVLFDEARAVGSRERRECSMADALASLAGSPSSGTTRTVNVHIDFDALMRGHLEPGEECSIEGIGPVPVAAAQRLAEDAYIRAVLDHGADVRAINTIGRPIPARLRAAIEARDTTCVVAGCDAREGLEIHHVVPVYKGGRTCMDNCCRVCVWHHMLITLGYWILEGKPGDWRFSRTGPRALIKPG